MRTTCEFVGNKTGVQKGAMKLFFAGLNVIVFLFGSTASEAQTTSAQAQVTPAKHLIEITQSGSQQPSKAPPSTSPVPS